MVGKQKIYRNLYQNYSEFVQFLNDYHIGRSFSLFLIYLPSLTIFTDLFATIGDGHLLSNLSKLNIMSLVLEMSVELYWLFIVVIVMLFIFLFMPIIMLLIIAINTLISLVNKNEQIGYFYNVYRNSMLCGFIRVCFVFNQKVFFPIICSLGVKFLLNNTTYYNPALGILFLTLSIITCISYDYYTLQIPSIKHFQHQYRQINFPYVILESVLILTTIVLVNVTQGIVPFICCVCMFNVRVATSHFLKFETGEFYYQSRFALFCGIAISLALCIAYNTAQYSIMTVCACFVIGLLFINKKNSQYDNHQYQKINTKDQITIEDIKLSFSKQKISSAFKQAVIISRRKNTHRDQLTIKILKNKCFHLQRQSRGSIKTANSLLLLQYEQRIIKIVKKFLIIQDKAIEVLTIMKCKQPKQQILIKTVIQLVNLINQNKVEFVRCMNINLCAAELLTLMQLFFRQLYNDYIFIRDTNNELSDEANSSRNKIIQKQLFNKDTALIVLNVLDQVGKITNVSNNMPNVLGYMASSLIGLSINELIPLTVRKQHDQVLTRFVDRFTSEVARNKPLVEFFAYTKTFHLQKVQIRYNFFLHFFQDCLLSGIIRKMNTQDYLIMTDRYGNIQGWTPSVGELFNFDEIAGTECNAYNIFPLIPAFIKSDSNQPVCFKSVFFRLSTMKTSKLMLFDFNKYCPDKKTLAKKQIEAFMDMLENGQIIEAFFGYFQINIIKLQLYENSTIKIIKIHDIKKIQNFEILESAILGTYSVDKNQGQFRKQFNFTPDIRHDKSFQESQDTDYSIIKNISKAQMAIDLNFTLQMNRPNVIDPSLLKFNKDLQKFQNIYSSRSLLKIDIQEQKDQIQYTNQNITMQSTFNPKIQRKSSYIMVVIILTVIVLGILIQDQISLSTVFDNMYKNRTELSKANRAQVIYLKTVFNPNQTYISEFKNGNLIIQSPWLLEQKMKYRTYDNIQMQENLFYIANIQVPSIIQRIYKFRQNSTQYRKQLTYNFYNMVLLYESIYFKEKQIWSMYVFQKKTQCIYKVVALAFSSIIYLTFLIFIHKRYQNQRKMTEAFFKFQKSDLDQKISNIKSISTILQKRCQQWFIDQQINQIKKLNPPKKQQATQFHQTSNSIKRFANPNSNSISQQQISQRKAHAQILNQIQTQLYKKRFYYMIGLIGLVFFTQALFLILYGVITTNILTSLENMIWKYDEAYLLAVYPNLKIANLFIPAPVDILQQYEQSIKKVLEHTTQYMPDLFNLLTQTPCKNCTFMREILNTNYRSFYSYFIQIMQNYNVSSSNLTELYYAVDVVVENVSHALTTRTVTNSNLISLISIFSLIVFFVSVFIILRNLQEQCSKLQYFLKFFDVDALLKNKHMSTIMAKNM